MASRRGNAAAEVPASYMKLVRRFPLRPVRSEEQRDRAASVLNALLDRHDLDEAEQDYLDVLGGLVERFESETYPVETVSDAEMLAHLIEARGVTQAEVARATGIAVSTVSEVLSGKRELNRSHIGKFAAYFRVSPSVFAFGSG